MNLTFTAERESDKMPTQCCSNVHSLFLAHVFTMVPASLYEAVFNASPTGHYLLSPTPEAFILAVNDAFLARVRAAP